MTAPIIVTATFGVGDAAWLDGLRSAHFPTERNHLPAHLTLFHHLPPGALDEVCHRLKAATARPAPVASVTGPMSLGRGTALRVRSDGLEDLRATLADCLAGLLVPQDAVRWRPHVTIQNKVDPAAARALHTQLDGERWPRALALAGLAAWWYRGGPWEPIRHFSFRGQERR